MVTMNHTIMDSCYSKNKTSLILDCFWSKSKNKLTLFSVILEKLVEIAFEQMIDKNWASRKYITP